VLCKAEDYVRLGVPNVWIVDPKERVGTRTQAPA
jgi:Uma2 family endonuclease